MLRAWAIWAVGVSCAAAGLAAERIAVPSAGEQSEAEKAVRGVFGEDLAAAKAPAQKAAVAAQMLEAARKEDRGNLKFVLLRDARRLAVAAGDAKTALEVITATVSAFESDDGLGVDEQIAKGNALWKEAANETRRDAALAKRLDAADWYLRAQPNAKGLSLTLVEKRLKELNAALGTSGGTASTGDILRIWWPALLSPALPASTYLAAVNHSGMDAPSCLACLDLVAGAFRPLSLTAAS
jgi:hypothetical protein